MNTKLKYIVGMILGALFAIPLVSSALSIFNPSQGGTGSGVIPSFGQILVGLPTGNYQASSSPTIAGTVTARNFVATGVATSTFVNGIDITNGCFAVNGICTTSLSTLELAVLALFVALGTAGVSKLITKSTNSNLYLVENYGAVGDGAMDDSAAFASAVAAMPSSASTNIYSVLMLGENKTYYIPTAVNLDGKRVNIKGNGSIVTTKAGTNSIFYKTTHNEQPIFDNVVFNGAGTGIQLACTATTNEAYDLNVNNCIFRMSGTTAVKTGTVSNVSVKTGTISNSASSADITGVGTLFTTELSVGDRITVGSEIHTVKTITDATHIVTLIPIVGVNSGVAYNLLSNTVTGAGTAFLSEYAVEGYIQMGSKNYAIKSISSDTSLTVYGSITTILSGGTHSKITPAYGIKIVGARHPKIRNCQFDDFQNSITSYTMVGFYTEYTVEPLLDHCTFQRNLRAVFAYGVGIDLIGSDALDAGLRIHGGYIQGNVYGVRVEHWDLFEVNGGLIDLNQQYAIEGYALNQFNIVNPYLGNTVGPVIYLDGSVRHPTTASQNGYVSNTKIHCHDNGSNGLFGAVSITHGSQISIVGACEITEWMAYGIHYEDASAIKIHGNTIRPSVGYGITVTDVTGGDHNNNEFFFNTYDKPVGGSAIMVDGNRNYLGSGVTRGTYVINVPIPTGTSGLYTYTPAIGNTVTNVMATPKGAEPPAGWYITNMGANTFDFYFPDSTPEGLSFDVMTFTNRSLAKM